MPDAPHSYGAFKKIAPEESVNRPAIAEEVCRDQGETPTFPFSEPERPDEQNPPIEEPPPADERTDKTIRAPRERALSSPPVGVAGGTASRTDLEGIQQPDTSDAANDAREMGERKTGRP